MSTRLSPSGKDAIDPQELRSLYEADETAWLDLMARLSAERRLDELDCENLSEFLESMARRDRRAVYNRLVKLLMHQLKWEHQQDRRSRSWRSTILVQQHWLQREFESSRTLLNHAQAILADAYRDAVKLAAIETGLDASRFPSTPPASIEEVLKED